MWRRHAEGKREAPTGLNPVRFTTGRIETMEPGERLTYQLGKVYWSGLGGFAIIERNSEYPRRGKKFLISTDRILDGKPSGRPSRLWTSNKAREVALWVLDKAGMPYR